MPSSTCLVFLLQVFAAYYIMEMQRYGLKMGLGIPFHCTEMTNNINLGICFEISLLYPPSKCIA